MTWCDISLFFSEMDRFSAIQVISSSFRVGLFLSCISPLYSAMSLGENPRLSLL
jgi:hypothetical protein